jgi:hypothetical protein
MSSHQQWMFGVPDTIRDELDVIVGVLKISRPDVARRAIALGVRMLKQQLIESLQGGDVVAVMSPPKSSWEPPADADPEQMSVRQTAQAFGKEEHEVYSWKDAGCPYKRVKAPYQSKAQIVFHFEEVKKWLDTNGILN